MGAVITLILFIVIFVLFLLSVFSPIHSQKKFWIVIHNIRSVMDVSIYCFYNLCAISTILYIVFMVINVLIKKFCFNY